MSGAVDPRRGGFALAMVVLLLFAVGIAGTTAYQIVQAEAEMAVGSEEANNALDVANAGLQRYLAESLGMPDTAEYAVGGGTATVTPRKMATIDADTDLYLIRAVGEVADPRYPATPARRVVSQYARLRKNPVNIKAALVAATNDVVLGVAGFVNATDSSKVADCPRGGGLPITGVGSADNLPVGVPIGVPPFVDYGTHADVADSVRVRWDVLQNPAQPLGKWDGFWPSFGSLPSDSFPVVRVPGDLNAGAGDSGRGVLIVPGTFTIATTWFRWDGIILAGNVGDLTCMDWICAFFPSLRPHINGMVIVGLDETQGTTRLDVYMTTVRFHRCNVIKAAQNIAYLEPLSATWWEGV